MKTIILLLITFLTGCATKLPVQVQGLSAAEAKSNNCLQCAVSVEKAVKSTGENAKWVSLPPTQFQKHYHAICVLEHEGRTFVYDSQFGGMTDLRLAPSTVFDAKGNFIGDAVAIHKRARPRDFHGVHWGNGLNMDLRGGLF